MQYACSKETNLWFSSQLHCKLYNLQVCREERKWKSLNYWTISTVVRVSMLYITVYDSKVFFKSWKKYKLQIEITKLINICKCQSILLPYFQLAQNRNVWENKPMHCVNENISCSPQNRSWKMLHRFRTCYIMGWNPFWRRFLTFFSLYCCKYRGSLPYTHFGTWKKPCYMKLVLVGLYCGPLLTLIPPLTRT